MTQVIRLLLTCMLAALATTFAGCGARAGASQTRTPASAQAGRQPDAGQKPRPSSGSAFLDKLVEAAIERTSHEVRYDATYFKIDYPNGDVPSEVGVCTDEVIRSYRAVGVDLQKGVHEDMVANFSAYPRTWGLKKADSNIDHRRVPNLMVFFERQGAGLPVTEEARDYKPGDVVTWDLGGGMTHIGLVVNVASDADENRMQIVHNIGAGPKMEDVLFGWKITGHYRYAGPKEAQANNPTGQGAADAKKKQFLELLRGLPTKGEFFTDEAVRKAKPYISVLLSLTEKDLESYDIYPFLALSRGLSEQKDGREYVARHFGEVRHPILKLGWGTMLFDNKSATPQIVRFLRDALESEGQRKLLSEMLGPGFEEFRDRVNSYPNNLPTTH